MVITGDLVLWLIWKVDYPTEVSGVTYNVFVDYTQNRSNFIFNCTIYAVF